MPRIRRNGRVTRHDPGDGERIWVTLVDDNVWEPGTDDTLWEEA